MIPLGETPLLSGDDIARLVDAFYAKVRQDRVLAPVFARAIAPDAWPTHLAKMYDFWSSVMLTSGRYKGNPLAVHARSRASRRAFRALAGAVPRDRGSAFPTRARRALPR